MLALTHKRAFIIVHCFFLVLFLVSAAVIAVNGGFGNNPDYDFDASTATVMARHDNSIMTGPGFQQCAEVPAARCGSVTGVSKNGQDESWAAYQAQLPFRSSVYAVVAILVLASFLLAAFSAYRRGEFRRVKDEPVIA